ncbi:MAG: hypothetical protein ACOH15_08660 [Acetobacterium sp.]
MKKLTKREKMLIYMLIIFGVLMAGFYLVVFPSYEKYQALGNELSEAQFQQTAMASAIENVPVVMTARDEGNVKLNGLKGPFSAHLPNQGLDSLITKLCMDYNLKPKVLTVSMNAWESVPTFVEAPLVYETNADQAVEGDNTQTTVETSTETTTGTTTVDSGSTPAWTGVVTMELTGAQFDFQRLVAAVDARADMIISAFDITPETSLSTGTTISDNTTINVTFTVYMVDK